MRSWRLCTSIWSWQSSSSTRPSLYLSSAAGSGRALSLGISYEGEVDYMLFIGSRDRMAHLSQRRVHAGWVRHHSSPTGNDRLFHYFSNSQTRSQWSVLSQFKSLLSAWDSASYRLHLPSCPLSLSQWPATPGCDSSAKPRFRRLSGFHHWCPSVSIFFQRIFLNMQSRLFPRSLRKVHESEPTFDLVDCTLFRLLFPPLLLIWLRSLSLIVFFTLPSSSSSSIAIVDWKKSFHWVPKVTVSHPEVSWEGRNEPGDSARWQTSPRASSRWLWGPSHDWNAAADKSTSIWFLVMTVCSRHLTRSYSLMLKLCEICSLTFRYLWIP